MTLLRKTLTHVFETTENVNDFDSFMKNFIQKWEYNNETTFKKQAVTNLEINVVSHINNKDVYPKIVCLQGVSLGNQSLNLISYEIVEVPSSGSEPRHHYKLQVYNDTDSDIKTDVKVQLGVIFYEL